MELDVKHRKRRRAKRTLAFWVLAALVLFAVLSLVLSANMRPAMAALAEARISAAATRAMNEAILASMEDEATFSKLVDVRTDEGGVYLFNTNARLMNLVAAACAQDAQQRIAELGEQGVTVPFGTITGISFLSGKGPYLKVVFTPIGSVKSEFHSETSTSGINQTLYRIYLTLTASVRLVLPGVSQSVSVRAEAAIAESIIVGNVPQVYTNVANPDDMLNLIPTTPQDPQP
ncbi:MAG: sporulation protein YunB [Clostridiaceae bacterium]|nr:sporulation protein YunB [Eubacteriales bacterium]